MAELLDLTGKYQRVPCYMRLQKIFCGPQWAKCNSRTDARVQPCCSAAAQAHPPQMRDKTIR
ncbi:hypothetical protein GCM10010970_09900 [Silvimonas iriomotensis]|uniref:Uncharacterized protein n=1 Tax=Silvimonas iriomotensis TaxID=449662 RepID=A0ABQ2P6B6_9NEIS|nr:hypothetical protein GCM10010970_09900 [Silvimonas iriomotensis]